ncbi:MAG: hypothetical protein LKJ44_03435 [Bifidobacteriaceae bacterium]|nr:hypothetical protein [Bifidobacteriaceae bacterium]MCI1978752.1 hypothetical protein [Bifidobacteriaceae bacterium]
MRIESSTTEMMVSRDGVVERHEEIVTMTSSPCYDLERMDDFDDLYQCGLARAQRLGQMDAFTERFNAETCCDAREKAMIEALKQYLRPQQAPATLLGRVLHCLDRLCDEEDVEDDSAATPTSVSTHRPEQRRLTA